MKKKSIIILIALCVLIFILVISLNSKHWDLFEYMNKSYDEGSKYCELNSDCVIFGKTGECNCGCYNKNDLPSSTGGACFCQAPTSCECVDNVCEGIFE